MQQKKKRKASKLNVDNRGVSSQAPPPPYYSVGRDNKGLDGSLTNGVDDVSKAPLYNAQHGYSYGPNNGLPQNQHGKRLLQY